jgi:phage gpG-like protein
MNVNIDTGKLIKHADSIMRDKLEVIGAYIEGEAKNNISKRSRHGQLLGNITHKVIGNSVRISANTIYAAIQELGGEIKPSKAKSLAVPINKAAEGKEPKDFPDLVLIKKNGKALLCKTSKKKVTPMFILLKSVDIPERPYLRPAVYNNQDNIMSLLNG